MNREQWANVLIRAALAFTFVYAAASGMVNPENWASYFPPFMLTLAPAATLLTVWGIIEIILALWLISGRYLRISASIAAILLIGITVTNWSGLEVLFRDLALGVVALGLAIKSS